MTHTWIHARDDGPGYRWSCYGCGFTDTCADIFIVMLHAQSHLSSCEEAAMLLIDISKMKQFAFEGKDYKFRWDGGRLVYCFSRRNLPTPTCCRPVDPKVAKPKIEDAKKVARGYINDMEKLRSGFAA